MFPLFESFWLSFVNALENLQNPVSALALGDFSSLHLSTYLLQRRFVGHHNQIDSIGQEPIELWNGFALQPCDTISPLRANPVTHSRHWHDIRQVGIVPLLTQVLPTCDTILQLVQSLA